MTACAFCEGMAPKTQGVWRHRTAMAARFPTVQPSPCGKCGGTDWMLTQKFIQPERRRWWQFWRRV